MFTEILKIIPKLSAGDLNQMERNLGSRFTRVAKKFGKGLIGALTGGGIAGLALGLIDKLLNPLKDTQEAIDRTLKRSDDLVTAANQFGTTAGKLAKLQAFGKSTGLDETGLNILIEKFQTAVAEAAKDPNKQTSVRRFVGEKDTAEAFFQFIQGLQKLDKTQQVLVQQEVFGEKQILKMADFLQTDFSRLATFFDKISNDTLTQAATKSAGLNDLQETLGAVRELNDLVNKSKLVNTGIITSRNRAEQLTLDKENQRIASYKSLATISEASTKILGIVDKGFLLLADLVTKVTNLSAIVQKLSFSRLFKGIFGKGE